MWKNKPLRKEILSEEGMFRKAEFLQVVLSISLLQVFPSGGVDSTMEALHTIYFPCFYGSMLISLWQEKIFWLGTFDESKNGLKGLRKRKCITTEKF